jgi:hypothetical protein
MNRFHSRQSGDPRWIVARFASTCPGCHAPIRKGAEIFYYPSSKHALCKAEGCGGKASRDFQAAKSDDDFMLGQFSGRADIYG